MLRAGARLVGDTRRLHSLAWLQTVPGFAPWVIPVIGKLCRFSENELKNERAVYVVHSEWLLVHSDIILE